MSSEHPKIQKMRSFGFTRIDTESENLHTADYQPEMGKYTHFRFTVGTRGTRNIEIKNIWTSPTTAWREGVGSNAVKAFLQWAASENYRRVIARDVSNEDAERFWRRNGFEKRPGGGNHFERKVK